MNGDGEKQVPWGLEQTPFPASGSQAGVTILPEGTVLNLSAMVELGHAIGLEGRLRAFVPDYHTGVWALGQNSTSFDGNSPTIDRTMHVEQYTGKVPADVRYADYGLAAKAMAEGIALHDGQVGLWNFAPNAPFCAAVVFTCISDVVMWWKRRHAGGGRLVAPPVPQDVLLGKGVMLIALALSIPFPLLGLTLLAVLAFDLPVLSALPLLKRALS